MQNLGSTNCDIKEQEKVKIYETHTKKQYEYYKEFFSDTPGVKVTYRQRTPEEELEAVMNQIIGYSFGERDIYRK